MLPAPSEILELNDGESIRFHVTQFQIDEGIIKPAHAPQGKVIRILRVHVPPVEKKTFPYYWDITGQGAIAQLQPLLESGAYKDREIKITASGVGAKKRHSVELLAAILVFFFCLAFAGVASAATVTLTWKDNSTDEAGFRVERRLRADPVASYVQIGEVGANVQTFDDATVALNTQYCYRVRGFNPVALSEYSNDACMMVTPSDLVVTFKNQ